MTKQKLQVWHIPQVPMKAFKVSVNSVAEGAKLMSVLANYDLFQYENRVKPDYANMNGLNIWNEEEGEFWSWDIEINAEIKGTKYYEFFDDPQEYLEFLEANGLTEEDVLQAMEAGEVK